MGSLISHEAPVIEVAIKSKGEQRCREVLKRMFNRDFISIRPNWLKNPETRRNLEIDCFCDMGFLIDQNGAYTRQQKSLWCRLFSRSPNYPSPLAVEYDGEQHFHFIPRFHKNREQFLAQQRRDRWKDQRCKELGILLIRVPYTVANEEIEQYLMNELRDFR